MELKDAKPIKDYNLQVRITDTMKGIVEQQARKKGLTVADYIRYLIMRDYEK